MSAATSDTGDYQSMDATVREVLEWGRARRGWRPNTCRIFRSYLQAAMRHFGPDELPNATRKELLAWMDTLPATAATRNQARNAIRAYFRYLDEMDEGRVDPTARIESIRPHKAVPRALSHDQAAKVWRAVQGRDERVVGLVAVMLYAALRASEACALRWVDLDGDRLWIMEGKGGHQRTVPLHPRAAAVLRRLPQVSTYLFPAPSDRSRPVNYQWCYRAISKLSDDVRIPFTSHCLRHSCATALLESGADVAVVQQVLGHESLATTQIYLRVTDQRTKDAIGRLDF